MQFFVLIILIFKSSDMHSKFFFYCQVNSGENFFQNFSYNFLEFLYNFSEFLYNFIAHFLYELQHFSENLHLFLELFIYVNYEIS